jgi:hypothetical protein
MQEESTNTNNPDSGDGKALTTTTTPIAKRGRPRGSTNKTSISQTEINALRTELKELLASTIDTLTRMTKFGEHCLEVKAKLKKKGELWVPFVKANLPVSVRYVQRCMLAAEKYRLGGCPDLEPFMADVWGHKIKELSGSEEDTEDKNDASVVSEEKGKDESKEEKGETSEEFTTGKFPKKERRNVAFYRDVIRLTDAFLNQPIAESEKLTSLQELYSFFRGRLEKQAEHMGVRPEDVL